MIISRLIPKGSKTFKQINKRIDTYHLFISNNYVLNLLGVWTVTIAGYAFLIGQIDRYSYWSWNGFPECLIKIILSTALFYLLFKQGIIKLTEQRLNYINILYNSSFYFLCFIIGTLRFSSFEISFLGYVPYLSFIFAGSLIYEYKVSYDIENDNWLLDSWDNKVQYMLASILLMAISVVLGFILDDPIISTVSIVSVFFPIVTLIWPNHIRHIKRLQFYPLFTFSMFVCVRAPWFLLFLFLLFFTIRSINYLKYGVVYPSFGVHLEEVSTDV
mgnify:CR=1 FL=1